MPSASTPPFGLNIFSPFCAGLALVVNYRKEIIMDGIALLCKIYEAILVVISR